MGLSANERAKAVAKLSEVQEQERVLEARYKSAQDDFARAWSIYGSELAGCDPDSEKISRELANVRRDRVILELALAGNPDTRSKDAVADESDTLRKNIEALSHRREMLADCIASMDRLAELLA